MIKSIADEAQSRFQTPRPDNAAWFRVAGHRLSTCDVRAEPVALLAACLTLVLFYYARSEYVVAMRFAERGLEIAASDEFKPQRRRFHHLLAVLLKAMGDNGRAVSHLAHALNLAKSLGDPLAECRAWGQLAATMLNSGQFNDSITYARRALAIAGPSGDLAKDAKLQCNQVIAEASLHLMHDPAERQRRLAEGLLTIKNAIREAGESTDAFAAIQLNKIYHTQTQLLMRAGQIDEARKSAHLCTSFAEQSENNEALLRADIAQAMVDGASGHGNQAKSFLSDLFATNEHQDYLKADIVAGLVFVYEKDGDTAGAERARADLYQSWQRKNIATIYRILDQLNEQHPIDSTHLLNAATIEAVETLAVVGEIHDDETGNHVFRVGALANLIARKLGWTDVEAKHLDFAARLHDIGKIAIHADIMRKPGSLTFSERVEMKKHTQIGAEMLVRIVHPVMLMASQIAAAHHERWDGEGYPSGLGAETIPWCARITAVADVFDALTHARCYKEAWPVAEAIAEISKGRGSTFDPQVVDAFMSVIVTLISDHGQAGLDAVLSVNSKDNALVIAREFLAAQMSRQRA